MGMRIYIYIYVWGFLLIKEPHYIRIDKWISLAEGSANSCIFVDSSDKKVSVGNSIQLWNNLKDRSEVLTSDLSSGHFD